MTKQNRIHKIVVLRQKGRKEILRKLYNIRYFNSKRKRRRTRNEATYKRLRKERQAL